MTNSGPYDLRRLDGKRIAIVLTFPPRVVCGNARFDCTEVQGGVLRIKVEDLRSAGDAEVIVVEREWQGEVLPGQQYGCDYCLAPEVPRK